ncbi:MAG: hypothetical protein AB1487_02830 [Thermodesulfobacteriota bacterium]
MTDKRYFQVKKSRTVFQLDYRGVYVVQAQPENGGIRIVSCAHKVWPEHGKELPFAEPEGIKESFQAILNLSGLKGREVDILLPDCMARTVILELDSLPRKKNELLKLAYFKGQKSPPYPLEDTRIGIQVLSNPPSPPFSKRGVGGDSGGKARIFAVFISRALIKGLENILCDLGMEPRRIGLTSLNLYNLFEKKLNQEGDAAFVSTFEGFFSLLLFSSGLPVFFRSKALEAGDSRLFFELKTSFLYYQNQHASYMPKRVYLWQGAETGDFSSWSEELFGVQPSILEPRNLLPIKQDLALTPYELMRLTPALGMVAK